MKIKVSPNARKAFNDFKEEMAKEIGIETQKQKTTKDIINEYEDAKTNLGRS